MSIFNDDAEDTSLCMTPSPPPISPLTQPDERCVYTYIRIEPWLAMPHLRSKLPECSYHRPLSVSVWTNVTTNCRAGETIQTILQSLKIKYLPVNQDEYQRIVVRRRHIWEDALNYNVSKLV